MEQETRETIRLSKRVSYGSTSWARQHRAVLAEHLGSFRTATLPALRVALTRCSWDRLPQGVSDYLSRYVPRGVDAKTWERIGPFVRDSVTLAAPKTPYTAELLIGRASAYVAWCVKKGWPLDAETIWSVQGINLYVEDEKLGLGRRTRSNYRGWLLRVAQVLLPEENGEPRQPIRTPDASAEPYTAAEMAGFRRWATVQGSTLKQYRAMLMLVLCAGAGLRAVDIETLKPEHVERLDQGGYVVHVQGKDARDVPLLAEWDDWMEAVLDRVPDNHTTLWGTTGGRYHFLSKFTSTCAGTGPVSSRLRETWAVTHLKAIASLKSLFRAAGVKNFRKLDLLLHYVDDVTPDEYIAFLRQEDQQ